MLRTLKQWLECDESPADFYDLLGVERCHPDRLALLRAARDAKGALHQLQDRLSPESVRQWHSLERQCALAEQTFANAAECRAYDEQVQQDLCEQYLADKGVIADALRPEAIRRWLSAARHVHAGRIERLVQKVLSAVQSGTSPEQPASNTSQGKFFSYAAGAAAHRRHPDRSMPQNPVTPIPHIEKTTPPVGDGPSQSRSSEPVSSEPVGSEPVSSGGPQRPALVKPGFPAGRGISPANPTVPARSATGSAVFWIVGSAIGAALVMGLIAALFILPTFPQRVVPAPGSVETLPSVGDGNQPLPVADTSEEATDASQPAPGANDGTPADASETSSTPAAAGKSGLSSASAPSSPSTGAAVELPHGKAVHVVAWSPNGKQIATAGDDPVIRIWDAQGKELQSLAGTASAIPALAWSETTAGVLASADNEGTIRVWDVEKRAARQTIAGAEKENILALAWKDAKQLVSADSHGTLTIWNLPAGRRQKASLDQAQAAGSIRNFLALSGTAGADRYITGHLDGSVLFWALNQGQPVTRMLLPESGALWQQLIRTGHISSGSVDDPAGFRSAASPDGAGPARNRKATPYDGTRCFGVATFGLNDGFLALANGDLEIWDISHTPNVRVRVLPGRDGDDGYHLVASDPHGNLLAAVDGAGELTVWNTARWKVVFAQKVSAPATSMAWSPQDARRLALANGGGSVALFLVDDDKSAPALDPTFSVEDILSKASEFKQDDDWRMLRRAVNLLDMYRLPIAAQNAVDQYQFDLRKAADELLASATSPESSSDKPSSGRLATRKPPISRRPLRGLPAKAGQGTPTMPSKLDFAERIILLQEVVDLDAEGKAGKKARELIERAYK